MWTLLVSMLAAGEPAAAYAGLVEAALDSAVKASGEAVRATTLTLDILSDGSVRSLELAVSSGDKRVDDLARGAVLTAEPFAPPTNDLFGERDHVTCAARIVSGRVGKASPVAVACFAPEDKVAFLSARGEPAMAGDAGERLFAGWQRERAQDLSAATAAYEDAVRQAPSCALARRALGLALVKSKRASAAVAHLRAYVDRELRGNDALVYARELERFEKEQAAKAAEFTRPRPRLTQADIGLGIKKGYALLAPCLARARDERLLAIGTETLLLTFRINKDGSVQGVRLEAPESLPLREPGECIERVVSSWRFPPYTEGSEITAKAVPIKVRGSPPPSATPGKTAAKAPGASGEDEVELAFAQCERGADEINGYLSVRRPGLIGCFEKEAKRAGTAGWPTSVSIDFVVDTAGPVRGVVVRHRAFRDGPLAACVSEALAGSLPPSGGADCPGEFAVDTRSYAR